MAVRDGDEIHICELRQHAHDVKITSHQRRCDVTLHRRWYDVVLTSCACWVAPAEKVQKGVLQGRVVLLAVGAQEIRAHPAIIHCSHLLLKCRVATNISHLLKVQKEIQSNLDYSIIRLFEVQGTAGILSNNR